MSTQAVSTWQRRWKRFDPWFLGGVLIAVLVILPVLTVLFLSFGTQGTALLSHALPRYIKNSFLLMLGVGGLASVIGITTAWLVVHYEFLGRRIFQWSLFFPLAVPAYIGAYTFVDFWEYAGPVQSAMRDLFGWKTARDYWFFETRSLSTAIFVIALSLYPYIYLLARGAFAGQSNHALDVARTLGIGVWGRFWRVALPMARPSIVIGLALVMMETLNDFGAVEYFAVQTLTTGIFTTWLEANDITSAARIALSVIALVAVLVLIEKISRKNARFYQRQNNIPPPMAVRLSGWRSAVAFLICVSPIALGFILPVGVMLGHALGNTQFLENDFITAILRTIGVSLTAAIIACGFAFILVYATRNSAQNWPRFLTPLCTIGYALPGAMLAVGILIPLAAFDHILADWAAVFGFDMSLILVSSAIAVVLAYVIRFFALAYSAIDGAMGRLSPNIAMASRTLGAGTMRVLGSVYLPLLSPAILAAILLVFVDSAKELPATLLLRPFGFETLSTLIYNSASREDIKGASSAALILIALGLLAVAVIARVSQRDT